MRRILAILFLLFLLFGCLNYVTDQRVSEVKHVSPGKTIAPSEDVAPFVRIDLNESEGPAPFWPQYVYYCRDEDNDLVSCEFKIDGTTFTIGPNESNTFADDFVWPDSYVNAINTMGTHTLELIGTDAAGHVSNDVVDFTVLKGEYLSKPGWYLCNNVSNSPCVEYQEVYCDKFVPTDIHVREAAAQAISKHPGPYSVNQILDVYDWVYENVFYQNVPVNLTYQPYTPAETLRTKSGDCKNHAVLIASMVESIGGTARVLLIPECNHAFAEVYIGDNASKNRFVEAAFAHYGDKATYINWHSMKNGSEIWMPLDTAGGRYPGNTIPGCLEASQTFILNDCNLKDWKPTPPNTEWIEYGPFTYEETEVIDPYYWYYFSYYVDRSQYEYCTYEINIVSKSRPLDWYIIPETAYSDFSDGRSYNLYYREEQVMSANYNFTYSDQDKFYLIVKNSNPDHSITVPVTVNARCYKK